MTLVRIRRDGNSVAVTIPVEELVKARLHVGEYVDVKADAISGRVVIEPRTIVPRVRPHVLNLGRQIIIEERALLDRLASHDSTGNTKPQAPLRE